MVGPSLSEEGRRIASRRLKVGFVTLVGCSGGLAAAAADATFVQALVAVAVGLLVGAALLSYLGRAWRGRRGKR